MSTVETLKGAAMINQALNEDSEASRDAVLARIEEKRLIVARALDAGVSPNDYRRLETVQNLLETSKSVFANVWAFRVKSRENGED